MSTSLIPAREDDTIVEPSDGPGKRLHAARQAQSMTQEDVADELHLSLSMIAFLERDDYDALPHDVFVVGYIRKYAHLVGLKPEPLLAAYRTAVPQAVPRQAGTRRRTGLRINRNYWIIGLAGLGVLILLGVLVFLWQQSRQSDPEMETTADEVAQATAPTATLEMVAKSRTPAPPSAMDLIAVEEAEQSLPPGSDIEAAGDAGLSVPSAVATMKEIEEGIDGESADAATDLLSMVGDLNTEEAEATEETTAAKAGDVEIIFDGPCWVDVRDKEEKYKLFGNMKKGDRYVFGGKPPYSITLGKARAVRIKVSGKPFDLRTVSRGGIARFTLNPNKLP